MRPDCWERRRFDDWDARRTCGRGVASSATGEQERTTGERGSVLLVLMASLLMGALVISGHLASTTEVMISDSHYRGEQAFQLAEAGVEHTLAWIRDDLGTIDDFLAGPDTIPGTTDDGRVLGLSPLALGDGTYEVVIVDNDEADLDPTDDTDGYAELVVTGRAREGEARLRVGLEKLPAPWGMEYPFLFGSDLTLAGPITVDGGTAKLHSNGQVSAIKDVILDSTITSSDTMWLEDGITVEGAVLPDTTTYVDEHDFAPEVPLPAVDPYDYEDLADYRMTVDGYIRDADGAMVFDASGGAIWNGWKWSPDKWELMDSGTSYPATPDASYFVEMDLVTGGQNGSEADRLELTLLVDGSVEIGGHTWMGSHDEDVLMVAGGDLALTSHSDTFEYAGHILVHEQLKLSGHINHHGAIQVEDAEDVAILVPRLAGGTTLSGHVNLRFTPTLTPLRGGDDGLSGWAVLATSWYHE